jgi:hypothetical protein
MRVFKFALPVLFVAGLALLGARAWTDQADAAAQKLAFEHARHEFSQRAAVVRAAEGTARYRDDLRALLRSWFADVAEIHNRFPMLRSQPAPFVPPAPRVRGGNLADWQQLSDAQVTAWREDKIDLIESTAAQGLRLDLLGVARDGQKLLVNVAVWGAPEEAQLDEEAGREVQRVTVPLLFKGLSLRFFDESGKVVARLEGQGEPALRLDVPERLTPDAPPGLVLCRFEVPAFPAGAAEAEWTLAAHLRTISGDTRLAQAVWKTKIDPAWAGPAWAQSADDKVVAESESEAKAAGPEGDPPAAQPAGRKVRKAAWPVRQ